MNNGRKIQALFCSVVLGLFCKTLSFAGGYAIPPQTAKAESMGGAATAGVEDPSAVYVNPAGLAQIDGTKSWPGLPI